MIMIKAHPKYGIWALALQQETHSDICILCRDWNHYHALVQEHAHKVYTIILGLQ